MAITLGGQPHHLQPMLGRSQPNVWLVRWCCSRNEIYEVESERLAILLGRAEMAQVNRIETAAEETYPHEGISLSRPGSIRVMSLHVRIWPRPSTRYL